VVLLASNFVRPGRVQVLPVVCKRDDFFSVSGSDHGNQTVAQVFESFEWERTADRHRCTSRHWAFYSLSVHNYVQHVEHRIG